MIVLALDIGQVRIGVAVSDPEGLLASPRGMIRRRSNAAATEAIVRMVAEAGAERVVMGLPISLDGQLHAQARAVQAFGRRLAARLNVPLEYWDERLSTVTAAEALRAAGVSPARMRERIDAAAAAVILQDYLDHQARAGQPSPAPARDATERGEAAPGEAETPRAE